MKTLLLTSAGMHVKDEILKILPKSPQEIKIAHIITASNVDENPDYVREEEKAFQEVGFQYENISLENKAADELRELFVDKDVVYVQGGNTFYLLKHVRLSGFETVVKEFIERGGIYIGASAGTVIAAPTIEIASWEGIDKNDVGLEDLTAMNLIGFHIFVHYDDSFEDLVREETSYTFLPVSIITDDQAILVQNDKISLVGKGKEVVL